MDDFFEYMLCTENIVFAFMNVTATGLEGVRDVLIQYVARMQYLNVEFAEHFLLPIEHDHCYKEYYQRCAQEIGIMKETKIYNNLSFSVLLNSDKKVISKYARNKGLVKAFEENEYEHNFPIYFASIKKRFDVIVKKQRYRDAAAKILSNVLTLTLNDPFHPINRKILTFLSDEDLKFLEM